MDTIIAKEQQERLVARYNPEGSPLRRAQQRMVEMLVFLDKICKEHNLRYWLDSGTLLGACRHGGFIPWDDDTDVCMPREDALKLKEIMGASVHDGRYVLQSTSTDRNYTNSSWFTLRDVKSEYIQDSLRHNRLKYRGLQIDIFIIDQGTRAWAKQLTGLVSGYLVARPLSDRPRPAVLKALRPAVNLIHSMLDSALIPFLRLFNRSDGPLDYGLGTTFTCRHGQDTIFPLTKVSFEGHEFCAPANPSRYLSELYGDWQRIPDEDKIQTHNVQFRFLN